MHGTGAPHRAIAQFGPIVTIDMGVAQPWGIQASPGWSDVDPEHARGALHWCAERGREHGWRVCLPEARVGEAPWDALVPEERIPMFAAGLADFAELDQSPVSGLVLDDDPSYESVVAAYGGWMSDDALARLLVVPGDLARPAPGVGSSSDPVRDARSGAPSSGGPAGPATSPASGCCPSSRGGASVAP